MGIPTICSDVGSCPELVKSGVNGYVIPIDDEGALELAIRRVLDAPAEAKKLGNAASTVLQSDWNWDSYGSQLIDHYGDHYGSVI